MEVHMGVGKWRVGNIHDQNPFYEIINKLTKMY